MTRLLSIALFGFENRWARCLASQCAYSERCGFIRTLVTKSWSGCRMPTDAAWHKIDLVLATLREGSKALWLDADCEVTPQCPPIEEVESSGKSIYLGLGHSKRFNSGVIYAIPESVSIKFFESVRASRGRPIPLTDRAPHENGAVINMARRYISWIGTLDTRWNNTSQPKLTDHIRHYTGSMQQHYKP